MFSKCIHVGVRNQTKMSQLTRNMQKCLTPQEAQVEAIYILRQTLNLIDSRHGNPYFDMLADKRTCF